MSARNRPGIARHDDAHVPEQTAVALLRESGQPTHVGHGQSGLFQRLDERVRQPLREFVKRHEAAHRASARRQRRMRPAISERHAVETVTVRPDGTQPFQQDFENRRGGEPAVDRTRCQDIKQPSRPGQPRDSEQLRSRQGGTS